MPTLDSPPRRPSLRLLLTAGLVAVALTVAAVHAGAATRTDVFNTNFESGLPAQFSAPGAALEGVQGFAGLGTTGHTMGGVFLRYSAITLYPTTLTLTGLPAHDSVDLEFLLAVIDSWDGTELYQVSVDGVMLFNHWFQLAQGDASDYVAPPGVLLSSGTELGFSAGGYWSHDRAYDFTGEPLFHSIPHTASTLTVTWGIGAVSGPAADQWQGGSDESWAIDGVRVAVNNSTADVAGPAPRVLGLQLAGRNPSRGGALPIAFTLASSEAAQLEVLDVQGRRVFAAPVGALGAGSHQLDAALPLGFAPGVYTVRLAQGGQVRSVRAVALR